MTLKNTVQKIHEQFISDDFHPVAIFESPVDSKLEELVADELSKLGLARGGSAYIAAGQTLRRMYYKGWADGINNIKEELEQFIRTK